MKVFICPECGSDPFKTIDYDKVVRERRELQMRFKRTMAQHGTERAEWVIREIDYEESMKYLQRKVLKQTNALRKLEEKLKKLGEQPYKADPPETMLIMNGAGHVVAEVEMNPTVTTTDETEDK